MTASPETAPVVRRAVYPTTATLPDGTVHRTAKLVITSQSAYVYVAAQTVEGVALAFSADLDPAGPLIVTEPWESRGFTNTIGTLEGVLTAVNEGGCGCQSSSLKLYQPFAYAPNRIGT